MAIDMTPQNGHVQNGVGHVGARRSPTHAEQEKLDALENALREPEKIGKEIRLPCSKCTRMVRAFDHKVVPGTKGLTQELGHQPGVRDLLTRLECRDCQDGSHEGRYLLHALRDIGVVLEEDVRPKAIGPVIVQKKPPQHRSKHGGRPRDQRNSDDEPVTKPGSDRYHAGKSGNRGGRRGRGR